MSINEEQYRLLCSVCDQILLERRVTTERLAISWLHILREHPSLLSPYVTLFSGKNFSSRFSWLGTLRSLEFFFRIARQLVWAFCSSITWRRYSFEQNKKTDLVIVTHMLDEQEANANFDQYFGPVAQALSERNIRVAVIYISHGKKRPLSTFELKTNTRVRRFILGRTTSLHSELRFLRGLIVESNFLKASSRAHQGLARLARVAASAEAFAPATLNALRIASQVGMIITKLRPAYLMTTYEGHAWERSTFMKAHAISPPLKCLGYQHSVIFRLQHAIRRPLEAMADPDILLATSKIAAQQLSSSWGARKCLVIGSPKSSVAPEFHSKGKHKAGKRCLVLPEGIESEATLLTAFCLDCAAALPDVVFVLRFHPAFNYQALLRSEPKYSSYPANVEISFGQSLKTDAASALWAIYRGSTAIIGAVQQGAAPVYLAQEQEMTIDPLYGLECDRQNIKTVNDFIRVINETPSWNSKREITAYCKEIISPLNMDVLIKALKP